METTKYTKHTKEDYDNFRVIRGQKMKFHMSAAAGRKNRKFNSFDAQPDFVQTFEHAFGDFFEFDVMPD